MAAILAGLGILLATQLPVVDPTLDRLIVDAMRRWPTPGLAVIVVKDGRILHLQGYGTKQVGSHRPVTPTTLFPLASCTKAFTTSLAAMLVADGKLGWDDPIRKYLPNYHLSDPVADAAVTVRDLLSHRTGIDGHDLLWYHAPWSLDDVIARSMKLPMEGAFRTSYQYSSTMFLVGSKAITTAGGAPWDRLIRTRICDPLGMTRVAFTSKEIDRYPDRAAGHVRGKTGLIDPMPAYSFLEPNPTGSLHTTARDLGPWLQFHLADGVANGRRLVPAATLAETKRAQVAMPKDDSIGPVYPDSEQVHYGMGWVAYDHRGQSVIAHGGVGDGFRAQITLLPKAGVGFALLNNLHDTKMNIAIGNTLIDHFCGLPAKDWHGYFLKLEADNRAAKREALAARDRARIAGALPSVPIERYVGEFRHSAYGLGKITLLDGRLVWSWSSFRCPLEHYQGDAFRVLEGYFVDQLLMFDVEDGQVQALQAMSIIFKRSMVK